MRKTTTLLLILFSFNLAFSQVEKLPENTGDNFSLEGALALFKKSNTIEEFENLLNQETTM